MAMSQKLFVRNLSWSVSEDDLYDMFGQAGAVASVKIPTRIEDGKPRGFAFVEMASPEAAQQAIQQCNGLMLYDRDIVVTFQDDQKDRRTPSADNQATKNAKLFVRSLGYGVTEDDLTRLFQQAGQVISVKIPTDRETGASKGFAFVEMGSTDEAEQAIRALNNTPLAGRSISIDYQDPNRSKPPSRSGGGYPSGNRSGGGGSRDRSGRW
jgi:nucleolin